MIGLRYNGDEVYMDRAPIDWEYQDDLFEFESIGGGYSWTVEVPVKGNQHIFKYASEPGQSQRQRLTDYDGFEITWDGNLFFQVSCKLMGTNKPGTHYELQLSTIETTIFDNLKVYLSEILAGAVHSFTLVGTTDERIAYINGNNGIPYKYPALHFIRSTAYAMPSSAGNVVADLYNVKDGSGYVPCYPVYELLKLVTAQMGYSIEINVRDLNALKKRLICSNVANTFSLTVDLEKTAPYLTLSELLKTASFYTGGSWAVDAENKKLVLTEIFYHHSQQQSLDLRELVGEGVSVVAPTTQNMKLSYDLKDDLWFDRQPKVMEGNDVGPYDSLSAFDTATSATASAFDYAFCKLENAYFRWEVESEYTSSLVLHRYAFPYYEYSSGELNQKNITSPVMPVSREKYEYIVESDSLSATVWTDFLDSNNKKLRVKGSLPIFLYHKQNGDVTEWEATLEFDDGAAYNIGWYPVVLFTEGDPQTVDIDFYICDATETPKVPGKIKKLWLRRPLGEYVPVIGDSPYVSVVTVETPQSKFTPRIMVYHGEVQNIANTDTYYAAGPDTYYSVSGTPTEGSPYSTNLNTGQYELVSTIWTPIIDFVQNTVVVRFKGYLSAKKLRELITKYRLMRHPKALLRFKSFRASMGETIRDQEIEGYSL